MYVAIEGFKLGVGTKTISFFIVEKSIITYLAQGPA